MSDVMHDLLHTYHLDMTRSDQLESEIESLNYRIDEETRRRVAAESRAAENRKRAAECEDQGDQTRVRREVAAPRIAGGARGDHEATRPADRRIP